VDPLSPVAIAGSHRSVGRRRDATLFNIFVEMERVFTSSLSSRWRGVRRARKRSLERRGRSFTFGGFRKE
jgi:hypothetical protein